MNRFDPKTWWLVGGVLAMLLLATMAGRLLRRKTDIGLDPAAVEAFHQRIRAFWILWTVLAAAFLVGPLPTVILFGMISFWALREFITLTPTRQADHRALFWVFFLFTPLQYLLVGVDVWNVDAGDGTAGRAYGLYSILIPVYAFLFVPAREAWAGDFKRFLERAAKIQAALMICVYCLSFAPALLSLRIEGYAGQTPRLLFYFVLVVKAGDVVGYVVDKTFGRRAIVPDISHSKTWDGLLWSVAGSTLLGTALCWATPFEEVYEAAGVSLIASLFGYAGGLTMSAIKRDRGVADYGTLVVGHGGVLDRLDSLCFAAPVFFHLTRYLTAS